MLPRPATRALPPAALILLLLVPPALAAPAVSGEFEVSALEADNKLVEGPDGNEWVTLSGGTEDVARITPAGAVTEYELAAPGTTGIAVAAGKLWITRGGGVTSFEASDPEGTEVATEIAGVAASNPIVLGPDGNLWVAASEALVRISPTEPEANKSFPVAGLSPTDIDVAGSLLAIANAGALPGAAGVVTATPTDPPVTNEVELDGAPQGVAGGPGGQVAYTQAFEEPRELGLFTPPSLSPQKVQVAGAEPLGIVLGQDGAYWSADGNGDRLLRLTTAGQVSDLEGFAAGSRPSQIATGAGGTLWATLLTTDEVGRVSGVEVPPVPPARDGSEPGPSALDPSGSSPAGPGPSGSGSPAAPEAEILSGPGRRIATAGGKIRVAIRFSSPQPGSTFECRLVRPTRKKSKHAGKAKGHRGDGGKAKTSAAAPAAPPPWRACSSPSAYELGPGHFSFEVRAVLGGIADPSPAKRPFHIVFSP